MLGMPQSNSVSWSRVHDCYDRLMIIHAESEAYYALSGDSNQSFALFDPLAGVYKTKDNSYVRIHTNFLQ